MNNFSMIILAGGKSQRMGTPKENLKVNSLTFLDVLKNKGKNLGFKEIIVSGIDIIDELKDRGPLSGMYSTLKVIDSSCAFIVPVDCPNIPEKAIVSLFKQHIEKGNIVTLLRQDNRLEPLIGVYNKEFYEFIYPCIKDSSAPIMRALDKVDYGIYDHDVSNGKIYNINTKEDLKNLQILRGQNKT